jgi:hypothetical protein
MAEEDKYVNSISFKELTFDDGNSLIAVDIHAEKFIEMLKSVEKNDSGYAKFRIVKRKTPSEWGHTHFMSIYVPKEKNDKKSDVKKTENSSNKKSSKKKKAEKGGAPF